MKIAVLGLGSIGLRHARNILAQGVEVVGWDPLPEPRVALGRAGGMAVNRRDDIFSDVSGVVIATPNAHHLSDLSDALDAGCHAFVEKPLAHKTEGVEAILEIVEAKRLCVFVGYNLRIHPAVMAARSVLGNGDLGTILWSRLLSASYLPDWRPSQDYRTGYAADAASGGVLFDISHEFDLALHLMGSATVAASVARRSGTLDIASEDCSDTILHHADGAYSTVHLDYATRPAQRVTEIAGTEGLLRLDLQTRTFRHLDKSGKVLADVAYEDSFDDDYYSEMSRFLACCRGQAEPCCDGREGFETLKLVVAARAHCGLASA